MNIDCILIIGLNGLFAFAFLLENKQARNTVEPVWEQFNSKSFRANLLKLVILGTANGLYSSFMGRIPKYTDVNMTKE